jgi:hypothetical protein
MTPHPKFRPARVIPGPGPQDYDEFEMRPLTTEQMDEHSDWLLSSAVGSTGA